MSAPAQQPGLAELHRRRRALRLEHQHVRRWRLLLRDRIELAVAAAAPPRVPGEDPDVRDLLTGPDTGAGSLPGAAELAAAVRGALPLAEIEQLPRLRALDGRLADYQDRLGAALDQLTELYITELARDPGGPRPGLIAPPDTGV
ncbi:hypothetical protein [Cellulomonas denverensis]|uniref:hypothetical protein n=1 Tax=Cellulomonas denverensis TaxID=264297 RepID=UPI0035EF49F7